MYCLPPMSCLSPEGKDRREPPHRGEPRSQTDPRSTGLSANSFRPGETTSGGYRKALLYLPVPIGAAGQF